MATALLCQIPLGLARDRKGEAIMADESITRGIALLKHGDPAAAQKLWGGYFPRLVGLARAKLRCTPRRIADEEDVALSAFDSFCRGAGRGRFPQLTDRDDLWHLLVVITARKAIKLVNHGHRRKRGGGAVLGESALIGVASDTEADRGLDQLTGEEPDPEFAARMAEQCRRLLELLDESGRSVALWKMEGLTNEEIAERLGCVPRTVERKLRLIRSLWTREMEVEK
jgi:DNA-directed RNA polymerase specialized sigma24 family protein